MSDPESTQFRPNSPAVTPSSAATSAALPQQIGRYRVEKVLGRGGFGLVYLAHDDQLHRPVAIKVPHPRLVARPDQAEAYLQEARAVAGLDHAHIVPVYDVGGTDQFPCFVVSKFIDGTDLAGRLQHGRLATHEAVELVATVAEALHHAHKNGLVHRDVKPGNILLDKVNKPFVADFGLALREQDVGTGPGFAGTPAYMSPEQARGEGHRVDGRSDVFSLGVVFYELLVGRRPFKGDSQAELLEQIATFEPRPPRQYDDTIPKELERVCLKALSKRATDRYTTAKDMADDLRYWIGSTGGGRTHAPVVPADPGKPAVEPDLVAATGLRKAAFISYATPDKEAAYRLCRLLEEAGVGCWIAPRDVTPGADYGHAIIRAIETTAATVLMLSAHSNASVHVTHEVERATSKRKRVIPVRLQDIQPGPSLELHLATAQWVDAWRFSPEQVAAQLAVVLRGERGEAFVAPSSPVETPRVPPTSDSRPIKIVPKGLRSFDAHDADFFLELLPGPRDRDGLPDNIRFWKTRIEETDADNTFTVGLIYGPSGCGKSSLVKAGLLPRLSEGVIAVYVEATAEETETRLLNGLRKRCPALPANVGLKETLAALRRGQGVPAGKKVLIVLDQFEQWLHAKKDESNTGLVQALRQCDGGRVQCVVMVRDDFWLAVSRFLRDLEVRLVEGQNSALADLFDMDHARKVLAAFGRAFGKFPEHNSDATNDQKQFLSQAVAGLAQEGKVISVRLALFAEMMKGKTWTPATLKAVGGTEGVGATFLEETFSAATAPPEHRYHQKAARGVLKALLPESGTDIKGHMRSYAELLEASGYASRPKDFDDLVRILDGEIRLITPTDPEGKEGAEESAPQAQPGVRYYQLTHDYLVPSLRDWLTRKQKETRRGRAELLLADRAAVWAARPENRQLPSLVQWFSIRWLTAKKNWSPPQRTMMRRATRYHAVRGTVLAVLLAVATFTGLAIRDQVRERANADYAAMLVGRVFDANTTQVPGIINEMEPYRRWTDPLLKEEKEKSLNDPRKQLHASLALLLVDAGQVDYLYERLLSGDPSEVVVIREALTGHKADLAGRLWEVLANPKADQDRRLRAACALAVFAPDDGRWTQVGRDVATVLVIQKPFVIAAWTDALKGAGLWLIPPLAGFLVDENRSVSERRLIASVYGAYATDASDAYARLETQLAETSSADATAEARIALAKKQASIGVTLLVMGRGEKAWPLLKHRPDPTVRSYLIERLAPGGVDPKVLLTRLDEEKDVSVRRAILLSLGEYGLDRISADRPNLLPRLLALYRGDPDPGIHGAADWLLRQWGASADLKAIDRVLATRGVDGNRQWYLNRQGQTMVVVPGPVEFVEGALASEASVGFGEGKPAHRKRIPRTFAIASKEVTLEEFLQFRKDHRYFKVFAPTGDCPVNQVSWYDAAAYCNWLSEREGIPKDQWCYAPNKQDVYAEGMTMAPDYLNRTGYRLPTEAEWEYTCRAGAGTPYSFGEPVELLNKYGWFAGNALSGSHTVGTLKPNDLGMFDMHGNISEWCQGVFAYRPDLKGAGGAAIIDADHSASAILKEARVLRGGWFNHLPPLTRSASRIHDDPLLRVTSNGFRPARTFTP